MTKNEHFRIGVSMLVALTWVMSGVCIRTSPLIKAQNAMMCYMDQNCFTEHSRDSLDSIEGIVSREYDCAVEADVTLASLLPCCEIDSMYLTMQEILALIEKLGMRSNVELIDYDPRHFKINLLNGSVPTFGRKLQFEFMRIGEHYYITDIRGLCEVLSRLSRASHQQTTLPKDRE